jgi:hypothetical protein
MQVGPNCQSNDAPDTYGKEDIFQFLERAGTELPAAGAVGAANGDGQHHRERKETIGSDVAPKVLDRVRRYMGLGR